MLAVKRLNEFRLSSSHMISGSLKLLEPSGPVQSCKVIALPYCTLQDHLQWATFPIFLTLLSYYRRSWSSEVISWSVWGRFADVNIAVGKKLLSVQKALHGTIPIRQCCTCITFWMMVTTAVSLGEWELAQAGRYISSTATMQLLRTTIRIACHYKRET